MLNTQYMKKHFFRFLNTILALVLSLIGYESCKNEEEEVEYGTPTAEYIFQGKVTDTKGNALPNVKVSYVHKYTDGDQISTHEDSLTSTDADGKYVAKPRVTYWENNAGLRFSSENDVYKDTFLTQSDLAPKKGGNGRWFDGRSENTIDITLDIHAGK